jgi:hypothetical protein
MSYYKSLRALFLVIVHGATLDSIYWKCFGGGMQIYVSRDRQHYGPYSVEQLREYLTQGSFAPSDFACIAGTSKWITIEQILQTRGAGKDSLPQVQESSLGLWISLGVIGLVLGATSIFFVLDGYQKRANYLDLSQPNRERSTKITTDSSRNQIYEQRTVHGQKPVIKENSNEGTSPEEFSKNGIYFFHPKDWEVESNENDELVIISLEGPNLGSGSFQIFIFNQTEDIATLKEFSQNYAESMIEASNKLATFGDYAENDIRIQGINGMIQGIRQRQEFVALGDSEPTLRNFARLEGRGMIVFLVSEESDPDSMTLESKDFDDSAANKVAFELIFKTFQIQGF